MDLFFFNLINGFADKWGWLDFLGIFFAKYSEYLFLLILVIFLWKNYSRKLASEILASGILSRGIITEIIRFIWARSRPFDVVSNIHLLLPAKVEPSFPSGHASFFFALATTIYLYNKKLGKWLFTIAFLMGLARIFVGYHWPSDILGGAVIGMLTGFIVNIIFKKYFSRKNKNLPM